MRINQFQDARSICDAYLFVAAYRYQPQTHDLDDTPTPAPIYSIVSSHPAQIHYIQLLCNRVHISELPRAHLVSLKADLGNAMIRVGGSALSGMKSLGGMAYNAATEYWLHFGVPPATPASPRVFSQHRGNSLAP